MKRIGNTRAMVQYECRQEGSTRAMEDGRGLSDQAPGFQNNGVMMVVNINSSWTVMLSSINVLDLYI